MYLTFFFLSPFLLPFFSLSSLLSSFLPFSTLLRNAAIRSKNTSPKYVVNSNISTNMTVHLCIPLAAAAVTLFVAHARFFVFWALMAVESVTTPGYTSSNFSHNSALWRSFTRNMLRTATDIQGEQISTAADIQGEQIAQLLTYKRNRLAQLQTYEGNR